MPSLNVEKLLECICNTSNCQERNCVKWDQTKSGSLIHIRIDGCVISSEEQNKCDCLIIFSPSQVSRAYIFLVEAKSSNYSLTKVIKQLQAGRDAFNESIQTISEAVLDSNTVRSMLSDPHQSNPIIVDLIVKSLSHIRQQKYYIIPVLYANRKIPLLKRTGYGDRFKIKIGGNKKRKIDFVKCRDDILGIVPRQ